MSASFRYHNYSHARDLVVIVVNIKARWSRGVLIHCVGWYHGGGGLFSVFFIIFHHGIKCGIYSFI